jgi:hypothetical protein
LCRLRTYFLLVDNILAYDVIQTSTFHSFGRAHSRRTDAFGELGLRGRVGRTPNCQIDCFLRQHLSILTKYINRSIDNIRPS